MPVCDDLLIGGTLLTTGVDGGMSIQNTQLSVADWSTLFGTVGMSGQMVGVYGRPGTYMAGDRLPRDRFLTLTVNVHARSSAEDCSPSELALMENTDTFLDIISQRDGTYLEVVLPDGSTRFTRVVNIDPGVIRQPASRRAFVVPLVAPWGHWWSGGNQSSQSVDGSEAMVVGGTQPVYDARLVFSGDGTFTHDDLGWAITIDGSASAVTVDLGERLVTESGVPAQQLMGTRITVPGEGRVWGWFPEGTNNVTSDVEVTVQWRDQWL